MIRRRWEAIPPALFESVQELIQVGRETGVSVEHSHEQIHGRGDWSAIWPTVEAKDRARREGVDIAQDLFPYTSVCTTMAALYPPWALSEGMAGLLAKLRDPSQRARIGEDFNFLSEECVSWASKYMTLMPGDLILFGTAEGFGPIQSGDTVEIEVEGIGRLRNLVGLAEDI